MSAYIFRGTATIHCYDTFDKGATISGTGGYFLRQFLRDFESIFWLLLPYRINRSISVYYIRNCPLPFYDRRRGMKWYLPVFNFLP